LARIADARWATARESFLSICGPNGP
jgi:hypothetical protein